MNKCWTMIVLTALAASVLCACRAATAGTTPATSGPAADAEAIQVVRELADFCRRTPPADHKPGEFPTTSPADEYLVLARRVTDRGKQALPALRRLADSHDLDAFECRLADILAERIVHPERFATVAAQLAPAPVREDPLSAVMQKRADARPDPPRMGPLAPEVVHPDVREAYRRHQGRSEEVYQRYAALAKKVPADDKTALRRLEEDRSREWMVATVDEQRAGVTDWSQWGTVPKMAPEFLLAWEEAMVCPLPWSMKGQLVWMVGRIGDSASVPTLAVVLCQTAELPFPEADLRERQNAGAAVFRVVGQLPQADVLTSLSALLGSEEHPASAPLRLAVGRLVLAVTRGQLEEAMKVAEIPPEAMRRLTAAAAEARQSHPERR